jgi:hypothetical protein
VFAEVSTPWYTFLAFAARYGLLAPPVPVSAHVLEAGHAACWAAEGSSIMSRGSDALFAVLRMRLVKCAVSETWMSDVGTGSPVFVGVPPLQNIWISPTRSACPRGLIYGGNGTEALQEKD